MITQEMIKEKVSDLEEKYVDFMVTHFAQWKVFAGATQHILDGEEVPEKEIPEAYILEFRMLREIVKMEATGKFDWNNPLLRASFAQMAQSPYYRLWGKTIVKSSLRLAALTGVKTLVEIGAGRGNLTEIMLQQIATQNLSVKLMVTDANPIVLESMEKLKGAYPQVHLETLLWDIKETPPKELLSRIQHPCLSYERASIMYATIPAIANIAHFSAIVVLGDMFNYTGELYAYDEISKKIGSVPLYYRDMKPILERCFREHFMFDLRAQKALNYPSTTILIALK
jgi:hypothetical protein